MMIMVFQLKNNKFIQSVLFSVFQIFRFKDWCEPRNCFQCCNVSSNLVNVLSLSLLVNKDDFFENNFQVHVTSFVFNHSFILVWLKNSLFDTNFLSKHSDVTDKLCEINLTQFSQTRQSLYDQVRICLLV